MKNRSVIGKGWLDGEGMIRNGEHTVIWGARTALYTDYGGGYQTLHVC